MNELRFAQSAYAYGFWLVVVFAVTFLLTHRKKKADMRRFADESALPELTSGVNFRAHVLKKAIILAVVIFSVLALMRPQLGFKWQEVKRMGLDIIIAMDTSKSMLASDVKPNRLERSKLAVMDLMKKLDGDRIGLVAFSGAAFLQCPLTIDYNGFSLALNDINVRTIPRGGTSISSAIEKAIRSYEGGAKKFKVFIIITDGEDHEGDPIEMAKRAKSANIKIHCIGIGTTDGELIQLTDKSGQKSFLKDNEGNIIKSRLNEDTLKKIALITGGMYVRSSGAEFGLDLIYEKRLANMEKREIKARMAKLHNERFQIPLILAFMLLLAEPFISDRKRR